MYFYCESKYILLYFYVKNDKKLFVLSDVLGEACGAEITERLLLPTVLGMATDSVANVR